MQIAHTIHQEKKLNEVKWKMSNNLFENEVISKSGIDNSRLKRKPTSEKG